MTIAVVFVVLCWAATVRAQCPCDCDGDGAVAVSELVTSVNIALDLRPVSDCPAYPLTVGPIIQDLISCVNAALDGCPTTAFFRDGSLDARNPFPSDRLRDNLGILHVSGAHLAPPLPADPRYDTARALFDRLAGELSTLDGFSTWAPIRVRFDNPVRLVVTRPGPREVLLARYDDLATPHAIEVRVVSNRLTGEDALEMHPLLPLAPNTRYVYMVTTAVRARDGNLVRPSRDLEAALAAPEPGSWLATVLPQLASHYDIQPSDIVAIDRFTTQSISDDLVTIQGLFISGLLPAPTPAFDDALFPGLHTGTFAEGTPEFESVVGAPESDTVAAVVIGTFPSFDFRIGPQQPFDAGRLDGAPPTVNHVPFYLTMPKQAAPAGGYPVTMFAPGLLNAGKDLRVTQRLAPEPMIGISISGVEQGERGDALRFFNFDHAFASRENLRQTVADYLQLARMIRHASVPPFDTIDDTRIHFMGGSLGAIIGTLYLAVEPDVTVGMLSVPGGGLGEILRSEVLLALVTGPVLTEALGVARTDPLYGTLEDRLVYAMQWALDPADPINLAPFVIDPTRRLPNVPPKRVLMHMALGDTFIPFRASEALAWAMGLPEANVTQGCISATGCSGVWIFDLADYGLPVNLAHFVTDRVPEASRQAARFLFSDGTEIIDAQPSEEGASP